MSAPVRTTRPVPHPRTPSATGTGSTTAEHPRSQLGRRWHTLRHGPPPHPEPSAAEQLLALSAIAEEALAVVPESTRMIAACGAAAMVPVSIGRKCGEQLNAVHRLRLRLEQVEVTAEYAPVAEHLLRLLAYHQGLVHQAIGLAFTARPSDRWEGIRARLDAGIGEDPAADLTAILDELRAWADDP